MRIFDNIRNGKRYYNNTILIAAAKYNFTDSARVLLEHGADVNAKNLQGYTALMAAVGTEWMDWFGGDSRFYRVGSPEMVKLLLANGADVNARSNEDATALLMAAGSGVYEPVEGSIWWKLVGNASNKTEIVSFLLAKGADVNARSERGTTALFLAVRTQAEDVARLLVQAGADKNSKDAALGEALNLYYSPRFTDIDDIIRLLLKEGANPNAFNGQFVKNSLLWLSHPSAKFESSNAKFTALFHLLLENGADVSGSIGKQLLKTASAHKRPDLAALLEQHGAKLR